MRPTSFRTLVTAFRIGMKHGSEQADRALSPTLSALVSRASGRSADSHSPESSPAGEHEPLIESASRREERGSGRLVLFALLALVSFVLLNLPDFGARPMLVDVVDLDESSGKPKKVSE